MVHGAIAGWYGHVTTVFPGEDTLGIIYPGGLQEEKPSALGSPAWTAASVASLQTAECVKVLLGKEDVLRRKLLTLDLRTYATRIVPL